MKITKEIFDNLVLCEDEGCTCDMCQGDIDTWWDNAYRYNNYMICQGCYENLERRFEDEKN